MVIIQAHHHYRLSRARMCVENAFGIYSARWRIFQTPISGSYGLCKQVVQTTVILHNYLITHGECNEAIKEDESRILASLRSHQGSNNYSSEASTVRDLFKEYFSSPEGSLPWQIEYVNRT